MKKYVIFICSTMLVQTATAQFCNSAIPASTPDSQFIVNGDEVTDTETGLIWQRCSLGQTGNDCIGGSANVYDWQEALQAAETERNSTGSTWRLPNRNEIQSIAEEKCYKPAINLAVFPNTPSTHYWSATPLGSDFASYVSFSTGGRTDIRDTSSKLNVRLVRDAQ